MTRINVGIGVKNLPDELLLAELREIKRLPYFKVKCKNPDIPKEFTLGKGHIKFFLDKLRFAKDRYLRLKEEATERGFCVTDFSSNFEDLEGDWWPKERDTEMIKERIIERIMGSKKKTWHYYGKRITQEEAIEKIRKNL